MDLVLEVKMHVFVWVVYQILVVLQISLLRIFVFQIYLPNSDHYLDEVVSSSHCSLRSLYYSNLHDVGEHHKEDWHNSLGI